MIKEISPIATTFKNISLKSYSFTCDICGVLIGTDLDFCFNDDYAVESKKVEETILICGYCKKLERR